MPREPGRLARSLAVATSDVFAVCDRIIVMRRGTKVADKHVDHTSPEEITGLITGAIRAA